MFLTHIIGLPRIGYNRDLKTSLEVSFNSDNKNEKIFLYLFELKKKILYINWKINILNNIDVINLGDFSFYDHILDCITNLNILPKRFNFKLNNLKNYFICCKGNKENQPMEMTKWFNTNYHYIVPEYSIKTNFGLFFDFIKEDIIFSKYFEKNVKFTTVGPFTLLKLGKIKDNFLKNRLLLLPNLIESYIKFLNFLNKFENIKFIQIEEPIIILNLSKIWLKNIKNFYNLICSYFSNIIFCSYFDKINKNILLHLIAIPFYSLHIDVFKNDLQYFINNNSKFKYLSLGIIDGKNIWINDFEKSLYILKNFSKKNNILISSSSSFLHIPIEKNKENFLKKDNFIKNLLSFSSQKIEELKLLGEFYNNYFLKKKYFLQKKLLKNIFFLKSKKKSKLIFLDKLQKKIRKINLKNFLIKNFDKKKNIQNNYFKFYKIKNTTIGSFPQTKKIRKIRYDFKNKIINNKEYEYFLKREVNYIIKKQIDYKIDVLVHGEPERNDMVEYFSENMEGFFITNNGWVQSYGSRYVKPPIIYGDIYIKNYITLNWIKYSQNLIKNPLKAILTGPITILKWSFRRIDQPSYLSALQISIVINKEIIKLEKSGIKIIQIDEPALIEFLPLNKLKYKYYFNWVIKIFNIIYSNLNIKTQIHTHICYSNFKNIIDLIEKLNFDVISIETSRSNLNILDLIKNKSFDIGLGIYDIHSKEKLNINRALYILKIMINNVKFDRIWINPDCGLKTRKWIEINTSLLNISNVTNYIKNYFF